MSDTARDLLVRGIEEYQAVVNGQMGRVRGDKPRSGPGKWLGVCWAGD